MEGMIRTADDRQRQSGLSRYRGALSLSLVLILLLLVSCAGPQTVKTPAKGVYHIVKKGETAYSIARAYGISLQDLAEVNNLSDVSNIAEGSVIFIPAADQVIDDVMVFAGKSAQAPRDAVGKEWKPPADKPPVTVGPQPALKAPQPGSAETAEVGPAAPMPSAPPEKPRARMAEKPPAGAVKEEIKREKGRFDWPVKGTVKTRFGIQPNKTYHNWIQIVCPPGARVRSAAAGTVIFSAALKGFGETIILRHTGDYATVYTHLKKRTVKADRPVNKGEAIAVAGETDEAGETFINFEIRLKGKARNPLFYLP
ncbi:MAG: M23 family metallopeptidase [Syntrophaceae bacterium]|nr:M23 family metallopeptidase [Syntrophaceae bacterium]